MARSDGSQSGGGLLGGIIGGIIGFVVGGPAGAFKGFVYGSTIGGILAPPSGPDIVEPRLEDLSVQTSSNVADLPRFDGTMGMYGNMIWAKENKLQEVVTTTTKKKKLLGFTVSKVKTTTYTYYLNCAIAFALMDEEDNCQLLKVWIGDKLVLNKTSADVATMLASGNFDDYYTFYPGTDDQPIDPEIEADVGVGNASAYPGICYMVIRDLDLSPWGDSASRAQVKVELSSGEAVASGLEFISQTPVPLHPQYVSNWDANFIDTDGLHVWKWGSTIAEEEAADTTWAPYSPYDFDKRHYIAIPSGGGYLKETLTDIIPREYLVNPATAGTHEHKGLRHTAKGKADVNAAVFVTAFSKPSGAGDGSGSYPNPIYDRGRVLWYGGPSGGTGCSGGGPGNTDEYPSFWEAVAAVIAGTYSCPGSSASASYVYDTANQDLVAGGVLWNDGAGAGAGFFRWSVTSTDPDVWYPPIDGEEGIFSGYPFVSTFSITIVMPGFNKEFILGTDQLMKKAASFYAVYAERFYWGATIGSTARFYEFNIGGGVESSGSISGTNDVELVRIGVVNDQLIIATKEGTTASLRIYNTLDIGDSTSYTDYNSAAILAAFGYTDETFLNNFAMDGNYFLYYDGPNVYKKSSFAATAELIGDASPEFIDGDDEPDFFNLWLKGNILAVSTFGGSMPQSGVQFFSVGILGQPGFAQLADILRKYSILAGIPDARINTSLISQEVRGHRVAKRGSVRNVIEQLRGCWPFDIVPRGYSLWYVPRGTSPVATISHEDLGPDVQWVQDREMTSQIPWRLSLRYLDRDLEYEINEQQSQRPLDSSTEHTLEIPVVFTPDEAAQRINILHSLFLTERKTFSGFQLPPTYRYLETADVINVVFPDATYQVRLTNLKTASTGLISGDGKPNAPEIYTSTATGSTRVPPVQTIPVAGGEITVLMDLPVISFEDAPGFTAVMASAYANWTGGELWRTRDGGGTWDLIQGFEGGGTGGTAVNVIGASNGFVIDHVSTLTINMATGAFTSVTDEQFYNEAFLVAYGRNGRWEIMACKNVTEDSNGDVIVDTFLRGLRGTEHNTGLHQSGDYFISLNDPDNAFISLATTDIGSLLTYRGISKGRDLDSVGDSTIQYEAENLTPWSPVNLSAYLDGEDIIFTWDRRDRVNSGWNNFIDIPMSEATESYEFYIYDELGAVIVRTLTSTEPTVRYTDAQQTTDFGSAGIAGSVYASVAQVSAVVGAGHASPVALIVAGNSPFISAMRWRIGNIVNNGHTNTSIVQITFRDMTGAAISVVGGTATASSQFSGSFLPSYAFDNNTGTRWASNTGSPGQWIEMSFSGVVSPFSVDVQNPSAVTGDNINDADIQWYDGTTWVTQASIVNQTGWTSLEIRNFTIQTL